MALNDPEAVRRQLFAHFDDPPSLIFARPKSTRLDYRTPDLERGQYHYASFADRPSPPKHPALEQLQAIVRVAIERLDYATTTPEEWETWVRFSGDRLESAGDEFVLHEATPAPKRRFINDSREDAQDWFKRELVPTVEEGKRSHVYILGEPGAGKSTFIKYLINRNARYLHERQTVFSRFEFIKFCERNYSGDPSQLRTDLSAYISFLLLRDLILWKAYGFDHAGRRIRVLPRPALQDIVAKSFKRHSLHQNALIEEATEQLDAALGPHAINFPALKGIKGWIRTLLVDHLRTGVDIALVIDGLDCVAFEDSAFDADRFGILKEILRLRPTLTDLKVPVVDFNGEAAAMATIDVAVSATLIFVMRENTFFLHGDGIRKDVPSVRREIFQIGNIDPEVALFNLVRRGVGLWAVAAGARESAAADYSQLMMRGIQTAFRFLSRALRAGLPPREMLGLFCGNLRSLFIFLERLIAWLLEDAVTDRILDLQPATSLDDVLNFLTGPGGRQVLSQRSYRLIELLLFYGLPWFEPLVRGGPGQLTAALLNDQPSPSLSDNPFHTGFLDNVFNYHVRAHRLGDELHPLLEKVRVIQLLSGTRLTPEKLARRLEDRLGYTSDDLASTLRILIRAQLIKAQLIQPDMLLTATRRGELLVTHVARSMTYLEHVYHQTLFPSDFLPIGTDAPREGRVESWTAYSIRNCFIFLAYMRFVESNRARGKEVPGCLRIYQPTLRQVRRSLVRIIGDPRSPPTDPAARARQIAIAEDALRLVQHTINRWDYQGFVLERGGRLKRPLSTEGQPAG